MAKTIYKTLFEVKLLHEFYLTDSEGVTVFDFNNQTDRIDFLLKRFEKSMASVNNDLLSEVPDFLDSDFKNYHLHLLTTYSGFEIAAEVNEKILPDGTTVYEPAAKLPDDFNLFVLLSKKNNTIDIIANSRIRRSIPYVYYFTNEDTLTPKTFPSLSCGIPAFDPANIYEQGELAFFGINDIRQFYPNGNTDNWNPVTGNGYANARDQSIVPWQFIYRFDDADNVTNAKFELRDQDGNLVRSFEFKDENLLQKVTLNFRNDKITLPPLIAIAIGKIYSLNVTVNNIKTILNKVIFFEGYDSFNDHWAVVNIKPKVPNADFSLYAADGFIKTRKSATGSISAAPVFEIRVKSRFTYWRYTNDKKNKLKISSDTTDFLDISGNDLVTKNPRAATYLPSLFKKNSDNTFHYLPNPVSYAMISSENRALYTDIPVPESKMFPVATS